MKLFSTLTIVGLSTLLFAGFANASSATSPLPGAVNEVHKSSAGKLINIYSYDTGEISDNGQGYKVIETDIIEANGDDVTASKSAYTDVVVVSNAVCDFTKAWHVTNGSGFDTLYCIAK